MKTSQKTQKTNSVSKKVGKATALVVALLVLIFALLLLLAPMKASDMFSALGMKNLSVTMAYFAADKSDSFDDWWSLFEKAIEADDYKMVCVSADKIEKHAEFSSLIADKKVNANGDEQEGKFYLVYQHARCSLLESPEKSEEIWTWCEIKYTQYKWGTKIRQNTYMLNPVKGYIDALVQNDEIPLGDFFDKAKDAYEGKGVFSDMTYPERKKDLAKYIHKLIEARQDEVDEETQKYWQGK